MYTHLLKQIAEKLEQHPLILFPEEEKMYKKVNKLFNTKNSQQKEIKNLNLQNYEYENEKEYQNDHKYQNYNNKKNKEFSKFSEIEKNKEFSKFSEISKNSKKRIKKRYNTYQHRPTKFHNNKQDITKVTKKPNLQKYNNNHGKKIRKINTKDINIKIKKHNITSDQFFQKNPKNNTNTNIFNSLISKKKDKTKKLVNDSTEDTNDQQIFVSGLITNVVNKKKMEEEGFINDYDDKKPQGVIINNVVKCFKAEYFKNQLDDLQDLLKNSQKYRDALNNIYRGKYTDVEFKGNGKNIYGFGDRNDLSYEECTEIPWRRPEEFMKNIKLYDSIHSNDIAQGSLGDCYFLAAISAIAEFPQRLERLFLTKTYQSNGIYVLAMCIDGIWQDIVLDDKIPCDKKKGIPCFNRSKKSNELWVILLEKAWAKVHGGYLNISSGLTREALRDLTGASAITYFTKQNPEELWEKLAEGNLNKFIMTAGSDNISNGSDALVKKIGICGSHAYSLLEVYELEKLRNGRYKVLTPEESIKGMRIVRLVKLRNPWGEGEWKGDWSDDSYLWTPELRKQLNFKKDGNDGVFLMNYKDFCKYYSDLQICYFHDGFKYSAIRLQSKKGGTVFLRFNIELKGKYYFSLNQKNRRHFPKSKRYAYTPCHYIVARKEKNGKYDYIGGGMRADKENWVSEECEVGEYIVMLKTPWRSFVNEFSFSVYGKDDVDINKTTRENLPKNFTQGILTSHALEDTKNKLTSFARQKQPNCYYKTFDNRGGYGYIFFQNKSKNTILKATVELIGSKNIKICNPYSSLRPSVSILPGQHELIAYESTTLPYSTQMRMITTFKNNTKSKSLRDQVKQSKTVLPKMYQGRTVDIKCYVLNHLDGLALLYVNNTRDLTIRENIGFNLKGCHVDGSYGSNVEICVGPGKERLLKVVKENGVREFSADIKNLYYDIK